jgi:hypothetical protein
MITIEISMKQRATCSLIAPSNDSMNLKFKGEKKYKELKFNVEMDKTERKMFPSLDLGIFHKVTDEMMFPKNKKL